MTEISEITILTIISISITFLLYLVKIILRSKCSSFQCLWGLFKVERDIKNENDIEKYKIDHNIIDNDNIDINNIITSNKNNNIIK